MAKHAHDLISVVVPVYNEADVLSVFHASLTKTLQKTGEPYEIIYCDDGSTDATADTVMTLHSADDHVKLVRLSRNFGKESALTAGIAVARGAAIITLDGDGQHPASYIPEFLQAWRKGAQVVVGVRTNDEYTSWLRRFGSRAFYALFNKVSRQKMMSGSTDYRLIDRAVQKVFLQLHESQRITRGLIDWLGFHREYVYFAAETRRGGSPGYSIAKLIRLALSSIVSLTLLPLYIFGYIGILISALAFVLGASVFVEQIMLNDPLHWQFTGTAMLGILIVFLVGIVLLSQGVLSLYVSHIHTQTKERPLYVIDYAHSIGLDKHS